MGMKMLPGQPHAVAGCARSGGWCGRGPQIKSSVHTSVVGHRPTLADIIARVETMSSV